MRSSALTPAVSSQAVVAQTGSESVSEHVCVRSCGLVLLMYQQ